jgi:uncharacterized protein YodC (DUF2158 family)
MPARIITATIAPLSNGFAGANPSIGEMPMVENIVTLPVKKPDLETPSKFKRGQIIQLKSGGAIMTIEGVGKAKIVAVWHDESSNLCTGTFYSDMVREVEIIVKDKSDNDAENAEEELPA